MSDATDLAREVTKDGKYLPLLIGVILTSIGSVAGVAFTNMMNISAGTQSRVAIGAKVERLSESTLETANIQNKTALQLQELSFLIIEQQTSNDRQDKIIDRIDNEGSLKWRLQDRRKDPRSEK